MLLRIIAVISLLVFSAQASFADDPHEYLTSWGEYGTGDGEFDDPIGVAVDPDGHIYVADAQNNRVQKFTETGAFADTWGAYGGGFGELDAPHGIAADDSGYVYVADHANFRVQKFDADGNFVLTWGSAGFEDGEFDGVMGIAIGPAGHVYVSDLLGNRIQKFTSSGVYLSQFGELGSGPGQFAEPTGLSFDSAGNLYVADTFNQRIQVLDTSGVYLDEWGTPGTGPGELNSPTWLTHDADDHVYVVEAGNVRIQKFTSGGTYLADWGGVGIGPGEFDVINGIAAGPGSRLYVADAGGNQRIQLFRPPPPALPDPFSSIVPNVLVSPGGAARYTVTVNGSGPIANAIVELVFQGSNPICQCPDQPYPSISALTDASGEADFFISGGGCSATPDVQVFADSVSLGVVSVVSPDATGNCSVSVDDIIYFTNDYRDDVYTECGDFDSDGEITVRDETMLAVQEILLATCNDPGPVLFPDYPEDNVNETGIAVHLGPAVPVAPCSNAPDFSVEPIVSRVDPSAYPYSGGIYIVVCDPTPESGVGGIEFGLEYDGAPGSGIDVNTHGTCAGAGPGGPFAFPDSGSGARHTLFLDNCIPAPAGTPLRTAVFYLDVTVHSPDQFKIVANPSTGRARAMDCAGRLSDIDDAVPSQLGVGGFGMPGYNPCSSSSNGDPVAVDDAASTDEEVAVSIHVLQNDTDPDGDPLTIVAVELTGTVGVATVDPGDTTITYTPDAGFTGLDAFEYVVSDGAGGLDTATVSVTVTELNLPPVAVNDVTGGLIDIPLEVHVLQNDGDPDLDSVSVVSVITAGTIGGVTISPHARTVIYEPPPGYGGTDSFEYVIADDRGLTDTAAVSLTVSALPDPGNSSVCLRACPQAYHETVPTGSDVLCTISVRDTADLPVAGVFVKLDFTAAGDSLVFCIADPAPDHGGRTGIGGDVHFRLGAGGGVAGGIAVTALMGAGPQIVLDTDAGLASCDLSGNLSVGAEDLALLQGYFASLDPRGDLNCDGSVNALDVAFFQFHLAHVCDVTGLPHEPETVLPPVLLSARPNPFRGSTKIGYRVTEPGAVRIRLLDLQGRQLAVLVDADHEPGAYTVGWGGVGSLGQRVASGVYLVRLETGGTSRSLKILQIQ